MKFKTLTISILVFFSYQIFAQETPKILLPAGKEWTQLKEGSEVSFELKVEGKNCEKFRFTIPQGKLDGMAFEFALGDLRGLPPIRWSIGLILTNFSR